MGVGRRRGGRGRECGRRASPEGDGPPALALALALALAWALALALASALALTSALVRLPELILGLVPVSFSAGALSRAVVSGEISGYAKP